MKKLTLTLGCFIALAAVCFVGCKKDKEVTIKKYFEVQNANLVAEKFPSSTSNETIEVYMNSGVLPGGSSIVNVEALTDIQKVLVGVPGEIGYYEVAVGRSSDMYFTMIINQKLEEDFEIEVAIIDGDGKVSRIWTSTIQLIAAGTGVLQVSLSFDNAKDVDLHLVEPNGYEIYYGNRRSENGGELDVDSNAGCWIDNINNENIFYGDEAYVEPGVYKVYVDLYSNCDPEIATNYVVSVFYDGELIQSKSGFYEVGAESSYNDIDYDHPFITFNVADRGQKQTKKFEPLPLTESAKEKMMMAAEK